MFSMEDIALIDLYEDLSVDKYVVEGDKTELFTEDLGIDTIDKKADNVKEDKIDLFTEALAIGASEKVYYELMELKRENERLRKENKELKKTKTQLSKNISSLFMTAKRELQAKEQEITKLKESTRQDNSEPLKATKDTTTSKAKKVSLKQPPEVHISPVSRSTYKPRDEKRQREVRDRLKQETHQSFSHSSDQEVSSGNLHKRNNIATTLDKQHTSCESIKPQHISSKSVKIEESKQSIHHRTHASRIHKGYCVSTVEKPTGSLGNKHHARKNKLPMSDLETPKHVKIRKIEANQNGETHQNLTPGNEIVESVKQKIDNLKKDNCDKQGDAFSVPESDSVSIDPEQAALTKHNLTVEEQLEEANKLKKLLQSQKDIDNSSINVNLNLNEKKSDFKSSQKESCEYLNPMKPSRSKCPSPRSKHYHGQTNKNNNHQNFVDTETLPLVKFHENGSTQSNYKSNNSLINLSESIHHQISNNYVHKKVVLTKTGSDSVSHKKTSSQLKGSCSEDSDGDKKETLFNGGHTKNQLEQNKTFSKKLKNIMAECNKSNEFDKYSNCNKNGYLATKTDLQGKANGVGHTYNLQKATSFITCTSNLILLGDEEASCSTFISPSKLQPSEFYPPGVRGDVHEGGSHIRHIRGLTEVISKFPLDLNLSIVYKPGPGTDNEVPTKTLDNVNVPSTPVSSCFTDFHTFLQSENKESSNNLCTVPKTRSNPVVFGQLENLQEKTKLKKECSEVRDTTSDAQVRCKTTQDWASTVNEMFGKIFHKKLKPN